MSRFGKIKIKDVEYDLDDLTLNETMLFEEVAGGAFSEVNFAAGKTMLAISYVLQRRSNPDITLEEAGNIRIVEFIDADEEMPDTGPPAETATPQNGSSPEGSGTPDSAGSIAG